VAVLHSAGQIFGSLKCGFTFEEQWKPPPSLSLKPLSLTLKDNTTDNKRTEK
jgi:hypothetical protein